MTKIIDLKGLVGGIKNSIKIMEDCADKIQRVLDRDYGELDLIAIDTYVRPYIHPQTTVCIFRKDRPEDIIFSIHYVELQYNKVEELIAKKITQTIGKGD